MKAEGLRGFFTRNNYENSLVLFSLWAHIQAAITSTGYHHADEHFQILEPLGWKLGLYSPADLAWEFTDKIRPGLQILLGWCIGKGMTAADVYSPFMLTAVLRQLSGLLWWALAWAFYKQWKTGFAAPLHQKALLIFSAFLWFMPYLHVRYSSENWGALLFFGGLYVLRYARRYKLLWGFMGGLLMALSVYFRFQMGFAVAGYMAWAFWQRQFSIAAFLLFAAGGIAGITAGTLADCWLYGEWVITPYNYYYQNIVAHKAAGFGVSPFYSYLPLFIESAAPPVSIVLLVLLCAGLWKARQTPYAWILVAFVLAHSAVGHKEVRFMFPMAPLLPLLCVYGFAALQSTVNKIRPALLAYSYKTLLGLNIVLMLVAILKPADGREALFKAFYIIHSSNANERIAFAGNEPFDNGLKMNFFRYCNNCFYALNEKQPATLPRYLYTTRIDAVPVFEGMKARLEYSAAPVFSQQFNIGNWQERTHTYFLWKIIPQNQ